MKEGVCDLAGKGKVQCSRIELLSENAERGGKGRGPEPGWEVQVRLVEIFNLVYKSTGLTGLYGRSRGSIKMSPEIWR